MTHGIWKGKKRFPDNADLCATLFRFWNWESLQQTDPLRKTSWSPASPTRGEKICLAFLRAQTDPRHRPSPGRTHNLVCAISSWNGLEYQWGSVFGIIQAKYNRTWCRTMTTAMEREGDDLWMFRSESYGPWRVLRSEDWGRKKRVRKDCQMS